MRGRCLLGLCVLLVPVYLCWVQCYHLVGMVHHSTPGMEGKILGDGGEEHFLPVHHSVK